MAASYLTRLDSGFLLAHTGGNRLCAALRPEGTVTLMADADPREPARGLYEVLGVAGHASQQEIALAWRRRARDEHPDARRGDDGAPARFRALAEAWQVLGDPGRRGDYDRGLDPGLRPGRVRVI